MATVGYPCWGEIVRLGILALLPLYMPISLAGQELQPRAYLPAPVGLNFFGVSYSGNSGGLLFDPSLPVENAHVNASITSVSFGETLGLFGRTGQVLAVLPYVVADLSGKVAGIQEARYRSGLADSTFRFAVNLHGAPAMHIREFAKYQPKTLIGVSFTVMAPTGQYDPNVLINIGTNRWAFKPELGISHFVGKWEFEAAFGAWLYTTNSDFFGRTYEKQDPLGSIQAHVVRVLPRRMWLAFDATFYTGGRTYIGNRTISDYQGNTRFGATLGIPFRGREALRFAYFKGATTRVGTDISSLSVAYQVIWDRGRR
ncbi:MAG: transporter [Acidobacteriaceae bacterium]|nr:transporter [Acidobacteriaceae bacterium]MBV9500886.1 transporter [Acidobacteriaceae bacterium]